LSASRGRRCASPKVRRLSTNHRPACGARSAEAAALYLGTIEDAAAVAPDGHLHVEEQLPWFEVLDDLPRWRRGRRGGEPPVRQGPRRR
jgi:hypothetical protein